jgi:hypothetical protein
VTHSGDFSPRDFLLGQLASLLMSGIVGSARDLRELVEDAARNDEFWAALQPTIEIVKRTLPSIQADVEISRANTAAKLRS